MDETLLASLLHPKTPDQDVCSFCSLFTPRHPHLPASSSSQHLSMLPGQLIKVSGHISAGFFIICSLALTLTSDEISDHFFAGQRHSILILRRHRLTKIGRDGNHISQDGPWCRYLMHLHILHRSYEKHPPGAQNRAGIYRYAYVMPSSAFDSLTL